MRVALVYDRVNKFGGAERILLALHEIWPEAPLYTAVYNHKTASWAKGFKVIPSFLQNFPLVKSTHEIYPWLTPLAFETFSFDDYDLVISVTSAEAKGIITKPKTRHLCYCLTPTRYLWSHKNDYLEKPGLGAFNFLVKLFGKPVIKVLKDWDKIVCQRPDHYLAISNSVKQRIAKYYKRESEIIYPPVDVNKFQIPNSKFQINPKFQAPNSKKYFLVVSRLVPYKKVDLVIKVFNQLGWQLKIVGIGREMKDLKKIASNNIEFLGELTDQQLVGYYQNCQAVIFPQEEDFGLVAVEAQACGKPVIAYRNGGARETIKEGITGEFFYPQTNQSLLNKLKEFKPDKYQPEECRKQAEKFNQERFKKEFKEKAEMLVFNNFL